MMEIELILDTSPSSSFALEDDLDCVGSLSGHAMLSGENRNVSGDWSSHVIDTFRGFTSGKKVYFGQTLKTFRAMFACMFET
jgi:hypothetical protein